MSPEESVAVPERGGGFFDEIYDGLFLIDREGAIGAVNRRSESVTGYSAGELQRLNIAGLVSGLRAKFLDDLSGRLGPGQFALVEGILRRKDGVRTEVEIAVTRLASQGNFLFAIRKAAPREAVPQAGAEDHESAIRARNIFQGLSDALLVTDAKGLVVDDNRRARELLRYGELDILDQPVSEFISGVDAGVVERLYRDVSGGRHSTMDAFCVRRDQSTFPAEISVSFIQSIDRKLLVFSIRSTERRRRMMELLRLEHNALQNATCGIAVSTMAGELRFGNRAFMKMWGYALMKDIVGRNIREFWTEFERADQMVSAAARGGAWHGELSSSGLSGKTFFVQASATANKDSRNRTSGLVFSFIDISDRKRAEAAIRREADAQMNRAREEDDFSGLLNIISVPDVMQLIDSTRKNGKLTVTVEGGALAGSVDFESGQVVRAACGDTTGPDAIYELMRRGGAAFQFKQGVPVERDPSIQQSTLSLLLEGSRLMDEERSRVAEGNVSAEAPLSPGIESE